MTEPRRDYARSCAKLIFVGCGLGVVLVLVVGVIVWLNRDAIRESEVFVETRKLFEMGMDQYAAAAPIRAVLEDDYPAQSIVVSTASVEEEEHSVALGIYFVNPRFDVAAAAHDVALRVTAIHDEIERYDHVVVFDVASSNFGFEVESTEGFPFAVEELLVERASSAAEPGDGL